MNSDQLGEKLLRLIRNCRVWRHFKELHEAVMLRELSHASRKTLDKDRICNNRAQAHWTDKTPWNRSVLAATCKRSAAI